MADRKSNEVILEHLKNSPYPVVSEENKTIPYEERKVWTTLWIVDPLDGTKEFIKRNGEFTVNIALVYHGTPILGVIYVPVKKRTLLRNIKGGGLQGNGHCIYSRHGF